jgi:hypothetical protein
MSGLLLAALTNGPAILAFIQQLISVGTDAVDAWNTITPMVTTDTAPTADQWAAAGLSADQAHAQVQAYGVATTGTASP